MNRQSKNWLDTIEFLSVSAAVVGTVASGVSQQAILATAPLSVSLALNLANRRRADRLIKNQTDNSVQQLHQDFLELNDLLSNGLQSIRQQLLAMPAPPEQIDFAPVEEVIEAVKTELESRLYDLEETDFNLVRQGVDQLQAELVQMREQIQALFEDDFQQPTIAAGEFDPARMFELGQSGATMGGMITEMQSSTAIQPGQSFTLTDSEIGNLQEWQEAIAQEDETDMRTGIQNPFPPMSAADASMIQERLLQLQATIAQLQLRIQTPPPTDFSPLQAQLDRLSQRFEQLSVGSVPTAIDQRIDALQAAIAQLSEEVKTPPANDDTALIFSAMRSLYERQNSMEQDFLNTVRAEIQNALAGATLPTGDAGPIREEIADLRSEIAQLQTNLTQINQQPISDVSALQTQMEEGFAQVRLEVAHVEGKIRDVAVQLSDLNALQQQVSVMQQQVKDGFAQLQTTIAQLPNNLQVTGTQPIDLSILQNQLEQMNQRLNQQPGTFDSTTLEQRIDELSNVVSQWRSETKSSPNEDSDFIFSAMRSLYERQNSMEQDIVNSVKSEVQKQLAPLISLDSDAIQEGILQTQTEIAKLKNQLQFNTEPKVDLTPLQAQITQINRRLDQLPQPFDPAPLERKVNELNTTITDWIDEVENSPDRENLKIFLSAMRGLYDRRNGRD